MKLYMALIVVVTCALPSGCFGQPASSSPFDPEWRLAASADLIVRARLEAPQARLENAVKTGEGDHERLTLHVSDVIKGVPGRRSVPCAYRSGPLSYMPSPTDVLALNGGEVLVFVQRGFLLQDKASIRRFEPEKAKRLKKEVLNQRAIAKNFAALPASQPDEFDGAVRGLIDKMLAEQTQQQSVDELQELDKRAARSVIRQMDDRRRLPRRQASFIVTAPNAFEGIAHYSPEMVVDVLKTIAGGLTGESLGHPIYNGGTEEERKQTVDAWRVYLHYHSAGKTETRLPSKSPPK